MKKPLKILIVEDNPSDAELIELELRKTDKEFESRIVQDKKNFLKELEAFQPDLILSDYSMPQFTGLDALEIAKKKCPEVPFIIVTDTLNEETAVKCIRWGAWDYVLKDRLVHLGHAVRNAIKLKEENEKNKLAEDALKKSEEQFRLITENTTDNIALVTFDLKAKYIYVSPSVKPVLGYDPEDLLGKSFFDFIHPEDKKRLFPVLKKYMNSKIKKILTGKESKISETIEFRFKDKTGNWRFMQSTINIVGKQLLSVARDITERKKAEEALKQSEKNYRDLFNNATDAIYIQDKEGRFLDVNQGAVDMYGYPKRFFIGKTPDFLSAPGKNDMKKIIGFVEDAFKGKPRQYDFWGIRKNGEVFPKIVRSQKGFYLDQEVIITYALDITERKQAEEELRESEKRFQKLLENVPTVAVQGYNSYGIVNYWNKANESLYGYTAEEAIGKNFVELIIPLEMRNEVQKIVKHGAETGEMPPAAELTLMRKDGNPVTVYSSHAVVKQAGREPVLFCMDMDLTERKKAEDIQKTLFNISTALNTTDKMQDLYIKIREFLGDVIDTTNFYVALYDEKTDLISLPFDVDEKDNHETFPAGKTLTNYVIQLGKPLFAPCKLQDELIRQGEIEIIGTPSLIWLGVPLKIENKVIGVIAVQSYKDPHLYTEKDLEILSFVSDEIALAIKHKQADEQIKRDLEEKEILLQEIHHRVKNNMQIISSLLKLQSAHIKDERALELFQNSRDRVKTMALIHDALYRSKDLAHIDFADYVRKLTTQIFISYGANSNLIKLNINIKDVLMDISTAIPCGLIINELVSNSLKYAFPKGKGEISISFTCKDQVNILRVKDNGIGISGKIDLENSSTLGLLLVNSLTKQLDGTLKLEKVKGTSFKIAFKKAELKTYGKVQS